MDLKEKKIELIPFEVKEVVEKAETKPWGIRKLKAPHVWAQGSKGEGVVIAILDTGIDANHPDLREQIIGGRNFTTEGSPEDFHDGNGHGTHVAGTIGAAENDGGVIGMAPSCKLLILKVLDSNGSGSYEGIINGINYATSWRGENGERVRIMNMSLGGSEHVQELYDAIENAINNDILVVCASGNEGDANEGTYEYGYPGHYHFVIEVAACDVENKLAPFSNNNLEVDVIAPGVDILSTYLDSKYAKLSGTSMATPHVTGALALLINVGEEHFKRPLCESEVYAIMVKNTTSIGYEGSSEGHGLLRINTNKM